MTAKAKDTRSETAFSHRKSPPFKPGARTRDKGGPSSWPQISSQGAGIGGSGGGMSELLAGSPLSIKENAVWWFATPPSQLLAGRSVKFKTMKTLLSRNLRFFSFSFVRKHFHFHLIVFKKCFQCVFWVRDGLENLSNGEVYHPIPKKRRETEASLPTSGAGVAPPPLL